MQFPALGRVQRVQAPADALGVEAGGQVDADGVDPGDPAEPFGGVAGDRRQVGEGRGDGEVAALGEVLDAHHVRVLGQFVGDPPGPVGGAVEVEVGDAPAVLGVRQTVGGHPGDPGLREPLPAAGRGDRADPQGLAEQRPGRPGAQLQRVHQGEVQLVDRHRRAVHRRACRLRAGLLRTGHRRLPVDSFMKGALRGVILRNRERLPPRHPESRNETAPHKSRRTRVRWRYLCPCTTTPSHWPRTWSGSARTCTASPRWASICRAPRSGCCRPWTGCRWR